VNVDYCVLSLTFVLVFLLGFKCGSVSGVYGGYHDAMVDIQALDIDDGEEGLRT